MLSSALIIFREALEISLILGVLLAATRGLAGRTRWVLAGLAAGIAGSGLVAVSAESISAFAEGMGQEMFNAIILLAAAVLIGWTVVWMRTHARELTAHLKSVGEKVRTGELPFAMLAVVTALAMLREGSEIVLFTYGSLASGQALSAVITGSAIGLAAGTLVGVALYFGLIRIPTKQLFSITSWLLILVAAGMTAQAAGFLAAADKLPEWAPGLWDSSAFVSSQSIVGQILHALVGYTDKPSGTQLVAYLLTIGVIYLAMRWSIASASRPTTKAAAA